MVVQEAMVVSVMAQQREVVTTNDQQTGLLFEGSTNGFSVKG